MIRRGIPLILLVALALATVPVQAADVIQCASHPGPLGGFTCVQDEDRGVDPNCTVEGTTYQGATTVTTLLRVDGLRAYGQVDAQRSCQHVGSRDDHRRNVWAGGSACDAGTDLCTGGSVEWWSHHSPFGVGCGATLSVVMPDGSVRSVPVPNPTGNPCPIAQPPDPGWGDLLP